LTRVPDSVERNNPEREDSGVIVPETADATLLDQPLRGLADVEAIERIPLESRLKIVDISQRITLGLAARRPDETAIFYVPDGDVDRRAVEVTFSELRRNISRSASLLRAGGIGRYDVVAVLLPAVPTIYWSIIGAMAAERVTSGISPTTGSLSKSTGSRVSRECRQLSQHSLNRRRKATTFRH
jgi:hypothetical protein